MNCLSAILSSYKCTNVLIVPFFYCRERNIINLYPFRGDSITLPHLKNNNYVHKNNCLFSNADFKIKRISMK